MRQLEDFEILDVAEHVLFADPDTKEAVRLWLRGLLSNHCLMERLEFLKQHAIIVAQDQLERDEGTTDEDDSLFESEDNYGVGA